KIIALTHVGYPRDLALIAKIPDVDVLVGGHSHSLLSNTDPKAEGPYPTMVDNPGGYKVPVPPWVRVRLVPGQRVREP
ncbi:hypothetical protein, partial [Rhizobium johnstonii]|uniref:hypothetical protein n=1 Tax=Rhizobium johnstonii TaxID=3019933 RepID=UPI003F984889